MRLVLVLVLLSSACGGKKVKYTTSSCGDVASCTTECDDGVVVACDRGGTVSKDAVEQQALFRKAYELWLEACDFGNPEACMNGAVDSMRSHGTPNPTFPQLAADHEACQLYEVAMRGKGTPLSAPCP